MPTRRKALLCDLVVHTHDVVETVGFDIDETPPAMLAAADRYLQRLQERASSQLDLALSIDFGATGLLPAMNGSEPFQLTTTPLCCFEA